MSPKDSFNPPRTVREEAMRALKWITEGKAGDGFTDVGRARARDLASGRAVSLDTVKRMSSYFARHEVDKKGAGWSPGENGYPSPGRVAWAAWGGDAGRSWTNGILSSFSGVTHMSTEDQSQNIDLTKEEIDAYLEHYGVKGQKWGVRRAEKTLHRYGLPKGSTTDPKDARWLAKTFVEQNRIMRKSLDAHKEKFAEINNKPEYKNLKDPIHSQTALGKKYREEHRKAFEDTLNQQTKALVGESPHGTVRASMKIDQSGNHWLLVEPTAISHAADKFSDLKIVTDENGFIVGFEEDSMMQSSFDSTEFVKNFLEHYGVKGQKWGVRRSPSQLHGSGSSRGVTRFAEKPKHLTDQELQDRIKRIETEKKYRELNKRTVSKGEKTVAEVLTHIGKEVAKKAGVAASMHGVKKLVEKQFGQDVRNQMFP